MAVAVSGFRNKSLAIVRLGVMEGTYRVLRRQANNAVAIANCLDAALTGNNTSTVGATCDFITSILAIGDIRDLLIQSWHYSIGDRFLNDTPQFDPLTAALAGVGLLGSGAALVSGPVGGSLAVVAAVGKTISKAFKRLGPAGRKAADTLGTTLGKTLDDDSLTISAKAQRILRYSPVIEIGGSILIVAAAEPKVFHMFTKMLATPDKLERLTTWLRGYVVRLGEELIAKHNNSDSRYTIDVLPTANAIGNTVRRAVVEALEALVRNSDEISEELLSESFDQSLKQLIRHLDEAGEILEQGAKEEAVIKALMNIRRIADEDAITKFVNLRRWTVGNGKVTSKNVLDALAELPEEAMSPELVRGIAKSLHALSREQPNFVKGNMFELVSYLSSWKRVDGVRAREVVGTQRRLDEYPLPSNFVLAVRTFDEVEMINGVETLIELKNYSSSTWRSNFLTELGIKTRKAAADEAEDVVAGQLLSDLVRHVEHLRLNADFTNPTGRRMAPAVLEAGEDVATKTRELNEFVLDYIDENSEEIAKRVWNLDISPSGASVDKEEWLRIKSLIDTELLEKDYIKIDNLSNLTG